MARLTKIAKDRILFPFYHITSGKEGQEAIYTDGYDAENGLVGERLRAFEPSRPWFI